jgi:hypothetical protein
VKSEAIVKIKGTLTIETDQGKVRFHDKDGKCILELEGLPKPIPDPHKIQVALGGWRREVNRFEKSTIIEMARQKIPVHSISRTLNLDGRKVSGIVAHARRHGVLPLPGPKEWSPRKQYPPLQG